MNLLGKRHRLRTTGRTAMAASSWRVKYKASAVYSRTPVVECIAVIAEDKRSE